MLLNSSSRFIKTFICVYFIFQLEHFRALMDHDGNLLSHNFRPVQPIGDRIVWLTSDKYSNDDDDLHDKIHGQKPQNSKKKKNIGSKILLKFTTVILMVIISLIM